MSTEYCAADTTTFACHFVRSSLKTTECIRKLSPRFSSGVIEIYCHQNCTKSVALQCCNVEQKMNTMKPSIAENGRVPNDRVVILDAGAQYGKVKVAKTCLIVVKLIVSILLGHRQEGS